MIVTNGYKEGRKLIRKMRMEKGMTLAELAKRSGVSRVSINRYELGTRVPDVVAAKKIASALGCTVDDLLSSSEEANESGV